MDVMIRVLYLGDICGKQLLANFLRVNISKIQAQQNSEIRLLVHVMMTKMSHQSDNKMSEDTKGYNAVELGL